MHMLHITYMKAKHSNTLKINTSLKRNKNIDCGCSLVVSRTHTHHVQKPNNENKNKTKTVLYKRMPCSRQDTSEGLEYKPGLVSAVSELAAY